MSVSNNNDAVLAAFYPFANETGQASEKLSKQLNTSLAESVAAKASDSIAVKQAFFAEQQHNLLKAAQYIADTYAAGGKLLTAGNGGSSCDAAHLAVEFMHPVTTGRSALPAINLSQDTPMITAVSNDVGAEHVLTRQLSALAQKQDTLVVFSTSGNSANLTAACQKARAMGLKVIAFTGSTGGELLKQKLPDVCLTVPSSSIHRIQECHLASYHILWDLVHALIAHPPGVLFSELDSETSETSKVNL